MFVSLTCTSSSLTQVWSGTGLEDTFIELALSVCSCVCHCFWGLLLIFMTSFSTHDCLVSRLDLCCPCVSVHGPGCIRAWARSLSIAISSRQLTRPSAVLYFIPHHSERQAEWEWCMNGWRDRRVSDEDREREKERERKRKRERWGGWWQRDIVKRWWPISLPCWAATAKQICHL